MRVNFAAAAATVKQTREMTRQLGSGISCCPFQYVLYSSAAL